MAAWVRDKALISMTATPLATDALIPTHLVADEGISRTFRFEIMAVSQIGVFDPNKLLNQPVCVTMRDVNGPIRYFHGIVQQVRPSGIQRGATKVDEFQLYAITVVPRLWFMNQTVDCRVYQNKSSQDILTAMFHDAGLTDFSFSVSSSVSRPYTVQFNESDYAFALRLMEQEGWFYYFQHTASQHTLTITDKNVTFQDIPNATLHFTVNQNDVGGILEWKPPVRTATGSYAMGDYDPENPGTKLYNQHKTVLKAVGADGRDVYHWPALTNSNPVVEARAKFEIEAAEAATSLYHGASHFGALVPGGKFTLANSPVTPDDVSYALRSVHHVIEDSSWISNTGSASYQNQFEAFKANVPWRQPIATPRPRMDGVHSAIVMGPQTKGNDSKGSGGTATSDIKMQDGEEIHTDELARVKVRFFWDYRPEASGDGSIWARVIQPWAGNRWGAQFIPRVGTEVAVAFVDGDPDRPIVVGGLYNTLSKPIYTKAEATKSGFRTRSSLKGDTGKFSELTFDDKSGSELIFIHAEKDLTTEVEHDEKLTVDNCRIVLVKVDETITVKGKQTITITKDHSFEVTEGNHTSKITKGDSSYEITKGNFSHKVVFGNAAYEVKGDQTLKVKMGNQSTEVSMGNYDLKLPLGNVTVKASLGNISMEAMQSIELKVGPSSIKIDPMGVTIKGMMVKIEGTIMTDIKGLMTKVGGDAMLMLKGAITMIN
jgi:type VI secretion system secreted protein VgrG